MSCTCPFSSTSRQRHLAVKWLAAGRHTTDSDTTSPSTAASWRPRSSRSGCMEVTEQSRIQDEGAGHPGAILRTVALPVDKVLPPTSPPSGGHDPADGVGRVALEVPVGRRGHGRRAERTGLDRFQLGDMKNWVNPETGRQTKADRSGSH
ncbi:hypothetical protein XENOCAPTIV_001991 [Xenoophorus captivus]|uniref:Uncharacterized protein n=1 Tax=Xenoophorus captivus TaxID=1517983 RepID=A0ABV0RQ24_9TELE